MLGARIRINGALPPAPAALGTDVVEPVAVDAGPAALVTPASEDEHAEEDTSSTGDGQ